MISGLEALQAQIRRVRENRIDAYRPYAKQKAFHAAGATASERLFMAGNQLGKTLAGAAECAMHLTGRYPDWWDGARFDKPVNMWAAGVTKDSTRDNPQRLLVGPPAIEGAWGTGLIPKACLKSWGRAQGVPNLLDNVVVRHEATGGDSILSFKSYDQGREKWQGPTLDCVWFDEEPPQDIYTEGLTRTNNGQLGQFTLITFTPLQGMSEVVSLFLLDKATTGDMPRPNAD